MITAPAPCVAMENVLCVAAPFGDALVSRFGIIPPRLSKADHARGVTSLEAEILDDGSDGLLVEPPAPAEVKFCQAEICIRYSMSCGGHWIAPYCAMTLHIPYVSAAERIEPNAMLRRDVVVRAQSRRAFKAVVPATYVVIASTQATRLIPMTKFISTRKGQR